MPRISVVVPIYQVEEYLAECLASIAGQTERDLEVLMVDDGSTDGSAAIARRFAARDPRFRLIAQPNAGLGAARNTGIAAASGEYLAFVDSDDRLPRDAYARLLATLETTGSDFATGNVLRLARGVTSQSRFLARAFTRTRLRTHVTRFEALLADRVAWNKLWRRDFWDRHVGRFPEGVVHEDIPVVLPAHFEATAVDVLAAPVYHYRARDGGEQSITQRRLELSVLRDRLDAVTHVADYLQTSGRMDARERYLASTVRDDLRFHLDLLDLGTPEYRTQFVERARALVGGLDPSVFAALPAIQRLKWHLLRRGLVDELVEVARFARDEAASTPPVRRGLRLYGDYPFRSDPALAIPRSVFRLGRRDADLSLTARLDSLDGLRDTITLTGRAHVAALGAPARSSQRLSLRSLRPGRWRRLRMHLAPLRLRTRSRECPDEPERLAWAGFAATLDARALARRSDTAVWELHATVRNGLIHRRRARFTVDPPPQPVIRVLEPDAVAVRVAASPDGRVTAHVSKRWALARARLLEDGERLEVTARAHLAGDTLELVRRADGASVTYPLDARESGFDAEVRVADLVGDAGEWDVWTRGPGGRVRVLLEPGAPAQAWRTAHGDLHVGAGATGEFSVTLKARRHDAAVSVPTGEGTVTA